VLAVFWGFFWGGEVGRDSHSVLSIVNCIKVLQYGSRILGTFIYT
jgi:hypothetical protein